MKLKIITVVIFYISIFNLSAQTVNIPDANFRNALLTYTPAIDTNNDGLIQVSEAEAVTQLTLMYKNISDMTGIQAFKNLKLLNCSNNNLTTLDVSSNLALETLSCYRNNLTSLDVTTNTALKNLDFSFNKLITIDLQFNLNLVNVTAEFNDITHIDLSKNSKLEYLSIYSNKLTQISLKTLINLKRLFLDSNPLSSLDLSCNTMLTNVRAQTMPALGSICLNATQYANRQANINAHLWVKNTSTTWQNCSPVAPVTPIPAVPVSVDLCVSGDMTFNAVSQQFISNPTYRWLTATSINGPWLEIPGATSQSITVNNLQMSDNGSIYKVLMSSADFCGTGHLEEAAGQLVMHPLVYPEVTAAASVTGAVCDTIQRITYTATPITGQGTAPIYKWYTYQDPLFTEIPGATNLEYTPATLPPAGTRLFVGMFTNEMCAVESGVASNILTVEILPTPAPVMTSTNLATCTPAGKVLQTSNTAASGTTLQWFKNGNAIANSNTPSLTIDSHGTYYMKENNGACEIASSTVTISQLASSPDPQVSISSSLVGPACDTLQRITYTAIPVPGTVTTPTYQWYNAATNTAINGATNAVYTPTAKPMNGDKVYVIIHKADACVANPDVQSNTLTAVILPTPAPVMVSTNTSLCTPAGQVLHTSNTAASGTTIQWYKNGNPIANSNTPSLTIDSHGTYNMTENNGACETASGSVTISQLASSPDPQVTVQSSLTGPACDTLQRITYTATPVAGTVTSPTYQWYKGTTNTAINGATDAVYTPAAKPMNGDKVYVIIHKADACVANPDVQSNTLTAVILPTPAPVMVSTNTALCTPAGHVLQTSNTAATGTQIQWHKNGNPIANSNTANFTIASEGTYHLTEDNGACQIATGTVTIDLLPASVDPQVTVQSSLAGPACDTLQRITYTATPVPGTVTTPTYQWYNGTTNTAINGATDAVYTPTAKPMNGDKVYVVIHSDAACVANPNVQSTTLTADIRVTPQPMLTSTNTALCNPSGHVLETSNTTVSGTQIVWYKNGTAISNSNTPTFTIATEGSYYMTEDNGVCTTTSGNVTIDLLPASVDPAVTIHSSVTGPACDTLQHIIYKAIPVAGTVTQPRYQWYNATTNTLISGATNAIYAPAAKPINGDKVYVVIHKDEACVVHPDVKSNILTADIRVTPQPVMVSRDTALCLPQKYVLRSGYTSLSGLQIQWHQNGKALPNSNQINYSINEYDFPGGNYHFSVSNGACTIHSDNATVELMKTPVLTQLEDIYVHKGEIVPLAIQAQDAHHFQWKPVLGLSNETILNPTLHATVSTSLTLEVTNEKNRCAVRTNVNIIIIPVIKIPNVITANGDGVNDTWEIENISFFPNVTFEIFNRWGNVVWKSEGNSKLWDGSNYRSSEVLPAGTYFYIINLNDVKKSDPHTGYIQIIN